MPDYTKKSYYRGPIVCGRCPESSSILTKYCTVTNKCLRTASRYANTVVFDCRDPHLMQITPVVKGLHVLYSEELSEEMILQTLSLGGKVHQQHLSGRCCRHCFHWGVGHQVHTAVDPQVREYVHTPSVHRRIHTLWC